jgi:hypothetical protein
MRKYINISGGKTRQVWATAPSKLSPGRLKKKKCENQKTTGEMYSNLRL